MKVYYTNIYLHSNGRRTLIGAFKSWLEFSAALGVSRSKANVDGQILDRGLHLDFALKHPNKAFEVVYDLGRGMRFMGYLEIRSPRQDKMRHRQNRGRNEAITYLQKNKGLIIDA